MHQTETVLLRPLAEFPAEGCSQQKDIDLNLDGSSFKRKLATATDTC